MRGAPYLIQELEDTRLLPLYGLQKEMHKEQHSSEFASIHAALLVPGVCLPMAMIIC